MTVGEDMGVTAAEIVSFILGETGLTKEAIGRVDLRARHAFVDVAAEQAAFIVSKLHRTRIKGNFLKVRVT
jgi:ATP-dependent RNA helicase DeaD